MSLPSYQIELIESRKSNVSIDNASYEVVYKLSGPVNTDVTIQGVADALVPTTFTFTSAILGTINLIIQEYSIDPQEPGIWHVTAKYGRRRPRKTGDIVFTFDSSGGSEHIQISRKTIAKTTSTLAPWVGTTPPDYRGAIMVSTGPNGGSVAGTNIVVPNGKFTIEYYCPTSLITPTYQQLITYMVGHTNQATFNFSPVDFTGAFAMPAYEVLFLGGTGQPRTIDDWQLVMHFLRGKNLTNTDPDGVVTGMVQIAKLAHDFYWAEFRQNDDAAAKVTIKQPAYAYVEQVYNPTDFTQLGPWSI
jgi:hypothetical protein